MTQIRLIRIQIAGFKTFREPLVLEIPEGLTAIVGPNGSGKSNLVDAILWAVGHQSARALRSERMEDVIFSGSSSAPPAGLAEVSLHFEVLHELEREPLTLTRRLYREGHSEYEINGKRVRLKDILDLCDRYQILSHSHAVIPQGHILLLAEMKPPELRNFIEEIAGISIYKRKKHETELKLEQTQRNLLRMEDILQEVSSQWEEKRVQAERTRKYREITEALTELEIRDLAAQAVRLRRKLERIDEQLSEARQELDPLEKAWLKAKTERDEAWRRAEELEVEREQLRKEHEYLRKTIRDLNRERERRVSEISRKEQARLRNEERKRALESRRLELDRAMMKLTEQMRRIEKELQDLEEEHEQLESEWSRYLEKLQKENAHLREIRERRAALISKLQDSEAYLRYWTDMEAKLREQYHRIQNQFEQFDTEKQRLRETWNTLEATFTKGQQEIRGLEHRSEQIKGRQNEKRTELQRIQLEREQVLRDRERIKAELEEIESDLEAMDREGMDAAMIDEQLKARGFSARLMRLRSIFRINDGLEDMGGRYLERFFHDWVARDEETAREAVALFMKYQPPPGMIWIASAWTEPVEADGEPAPFLEMTVEAEWARRFGKAFTARFLSVDERTIESKKDVPYGWGLVWAGADRPTQAAWWYRAQRRRQEGQKEWNRLGKRLNQLESMFERAKKALQDLDEEHEAVIKELETLRARNRAVGSRIETIRNKIMALEDHETRRRAEHEQLTISLQRAKEQKEQIVTRLAEEKSQLEKVEKALKELEAIHATHQAERQRREASRLKMQRMMGEARQKRDDIAHRLEELEGQRRRIEKEWAELDVRLKEQGTMLNRLREERKDLDRERAALERRTETIESQLKAYEKRATEWMETLQRYEIRLTEAQRTRERILDRIRGLEIQHVESRTRYEQLLDRMREFAPDRDVEAVVSVAKGLTAADRRRYRRLREELEALGEVNMMAEQEFAAIDERYRFLKQQAMDLHNAVEQLQEAMHRLDDQILEKIELTLEAMNEKFADYMKTFLGGEGELVWSDPEDRMISGVQMKVQIPGKRIRSILQLSGGEKTMVGLALLMAARAVRPSAFMVLDEVDAPLDDVNVDRFFERLLKDEPSGQFLIITHNKRTIQYARAIYGVTADQGISQVLSLRLDQATEMIEQQQSDSHVLSSSDSARI